MRLWFLGVACFALAAACGTAASSDLFGNPSDAGTGDGSANDASDDTSHDAADEGDAQIGDGAIDADAALPDGGFEHTYFAACLPEFAGGNVAKAFRYRATARYVPTPDGGTIDLSLEPLEKTATALDETVGAAWSDGGSVANERFVVDFGAATLAAAANPISTNKVVFESVILRGIMTDPPAHFCAELDGLITDPQEIDMNGAGDVCLFEKASGPAASTPDLDAAAFKCQ